MNEHISIEKMILGDISTEELKHISSCKKCNNLYNSIFSKTPDHIITTVGNKVREELILKFREMKILGQLGKAKQQKETQETKKEKLFKYIAISLSFISFIILTITLLYIGNYRYTTTEKLNYEGKVYLSLENLSKDNIEIETDNSTLIIKLKHPPQNFSLKGTIKENFQNIKLILDGQVYQFLASEFNITFSDNKLLVNSNQLTPTKEETKTQKFRNEVILTNGTTIECNIVEIESTFIIIDTEEGKRRLKKSEISKIKYLY